MRVLFWVEVTALPEREYLETVRMRRSARSSCVHDDSESRNAIARKPGDKNVEVNSKPTSEPPTPSASAR